MGWMCGPAQQKEGEGGGEMDVPPRNSHGEKRFQITACGHMHVHFAHGGSWWIMVDDGGSSHLQKSFRVRDKSSAHFVCICSHDPASAACGAIRVEPQHEENEGESSTDSQELPAPEVLGHGLWLVPCGLCGSSQCDRFQELEPLCLPCDREYLSHGLQVGGLPPGGIRIRKPEGSMLVGFLLPVWCICMRSLDRQESSALRGQSLLWLGSGAELQPAGVSSLHSRQVAPCLPSGRSMRLAECHVHLPLWCHYSHHTCNWHYDRYRLNLWANQHDLPPKRLQAFQFERRGAGRSGR